MGTLLAALRLTATAALVATLVWGSAATATASSAPAWLGVESLGAGGTSIASAVKVAAGGDIYVTGRFSSTWSIGHRTLVSHGNADIFLAKIAASGRLLWIVQAGGPQDDFGNGLDLDKQGNIYVTGAVTNGSFGSTSGAAAPISGKGQVLFLAKYSPAGVLAWVQTGVVGDPYLVNSGNGVAVNGVTGTVYITAISQSTATFSSRSGTKYAVPGPGTWHMVLAKYDTEGYFKWAQTNAARPNSIPHGVAVDASDNAYVAGWLEDGTTFSSADGRAIGVNGFSPAQATSDYPDDAFLAKYDANGNVKWVNHIGGYKGIGNAVAVTPRGEVSIVGFIGNIGYGLPVEASTIVTSAPPGAGADLGGGISTNPYNPDVVVATYTTSGVLQTALRVGVSSQETATGALYDCRGNLFVTGLIKGATGPTTLFVSKYSGSTLLWEQTAGNAGIWAAENTTPALGLSPFGDVYVAGGYTGTASFGTLSISGAGTSNAFLARLPPT